MEIIDILEDIYKDSKCELDYYDDYSLLIAVCLSAQTTDKRVNEVTKELFKEYPNVYKLAKADITNLENIIRPLGLFKNKSKAIKSLANYVVDNLGGIIPNKFEELVKLPGVGRKTANVLLAEYYNYPCMPVDTHVSRVAKRLGLADNEDSVFEIENKLVEIIPSEKLARAHLYLLLFGRYTCLAKNPKCEICKLKKFCKNR